MARSDECRRSLRPGYLASSLASASRGKLLLDELLEGREGPPDQLPEAVDGEGGGAGHPVGPVVAGVALRLPGIPARIQTDLERATVEAQVAGVPHEAGHFQRTPV